MIIIGIDPGISGAVCILTNGKITEIYEMPTMIDGKKNKKQVNGAEITNIINKEIENEKDVKVAIGRFGPYVQNGSLFASIPKEEDPMHVNLERALELIAVKKQADIEKFINSFEHESGQIQLLKGRWGPYIKHEKKNYKIPKDVEAADITLEEALKYIAEAPSACYSSNTPEPILGQLLLERLTRCHCSTPC